MCELRSGSYIVRKVITKSNYEIALDADPMSTQVVHRNHLVESLPRDNELPNLSSSYEKPFNDDKTELFLTNMQKTDSLNRISKLIDFLNDNL